MDEQPGTTDAPADAEWVTNEVRTACGDCTVTITVRSPLSPDVDAVRAAIGDVVRGVEALLGFH